MSQFELIQGGSSRIELLVLQTEGLYNQDLQTISRG